MLGEKARMFACSHGGATVPFERRQLLSSSFMVEEIKKFLLGRRGGVALRGQCRAGEKKQKDGKMGFMKRRVFDDPQGLKPQILGQIFSTQA